MSKKLEIAIPTYNRKVELYGNLKVISSEYMKLPLEFRNEILISVYDNNSDYDIDAVIDDFKIMLPINLIKSSENVGATLNFEKCIRGASCEYLWILGDDDYIVDGKLLNVFEELNSCQNTLFFIPFSNYVSSKVRAEKGKDFVERVSYYPTMISSIIFPVIFLSKVKPKFLNTKLHHLYYFYLCIELGCDTKAFNEVIVKSEFENNSGNYNWFEVFCDDFILILNDIENFKNKKALGKVKNNIYYSMILPRLLSYRVNIDIHSKFKNENIERSYQRVYNNYCNSLMKITIFKIIKIFPDIILMMLLKLKRM